MNRNSVLRIVVGFSLCGAVVLGQDSAEHRAGPDAAKRAEAPAKLRNNSLDDLFKCYASLRDPYHPDGGATFGYILSPLHGLPRIEAGFPFVVPYGNDHGFLIREGTKTYVVSIPNDGKNFERRLVFPPMDTYILAGHWEPFGARMDYKRAWYQDDGKGNYLVPFFLTEKDWAAYGDKKKRNVMDVAPVYPKQLKDDDATAIAALQRKFDGMFVDHAGWILESVAHASLPAGGDREERIDRDDFLLRKLGEPREALATLNACVGALEPNGPQLKSLVSRLTELLPAWEHNYRIAVERQAAISEGRQRAAALREGIRSVPVPKGDR